MIERIGAAFVLLLLSGQTMAAPPQRIMSLKVCTDELLMDLVPPSRIASLSFLSQEKAALKLWPQAAHIPVNHNSAEEVLTVKPDLILTDNFTAPEMRVFLARSGAKVVEVPAADSFDQIRAVVRQVGRAVDENARAEALIADMDATLHKLDAGQPAHPIRVAGWGGGGFVPGRQTLFNTVLEKAGGTNIAAHDDYYDVEGLIMARPDVLAYADDYVDTPSLRQDQNAHPLLLKLFANRRIVYPAATFNCGLPQSAAAALALRAQLQAAMARPGGAP